MKVAVSLVGLAQPRTTGLERYGIELVKALRQYAPADVSVVPLVHGWAAVELGGSCAVVPRRLPRPVAAEAWTAGWLRRHRPDLLHVASFAAPAGVGVPFVATVHDTVAWDMPEAQSRGGRLYFRPALERSLRSRQLRAVVAHADWTAQEIRRRWHLTVPAAGIGIGLAPVWFSAPAGDRPDGPVRLLTVGTHEPRKGLDVVDRAVRLLTTAGVPFEWRLVGRNGWGEVAPPAGVTLVGVVDDDELRRLYRRADVLVAPSLAEGFDLPVAEALAGGAAVVASDIPVHAELFGDVARLVPAGDAEALADVLTWWAERVERGERSAQALHDERDGRAVLARRFSWEDTVDTLVRIWRQAAS